MIKIGISMVPFCTVFSTEDFYEYDEFIRDLSKSKILHKVDRRDGRYCVEVRTRYKDEAIELMKK